jgi:hypothetical protein
MEALIHDHHIHSGNLHSVLLALAEAWTGMPVI